MLAKHSMRRLARSNQFSLKKETISERIRNFEYAVRGAVAIRAMEIEREIEKGVKYPFDKIVHLNIGNPQALGQKPITFNREVLACAMYDHQDSNRKHYSKEAVDRADFYLKSINHRATGAYTDSAGLRSVISEVKTFLEKRDGTDVDMESIYLLNGASEGITILVRLLIQNDTDGIMIPTPQYPIYSALVTRFGGYQVPYYLDEENQWGMTEEELETSYQRAVDNGITVRGIVTINPGNPTGQVLSEKDLQTVLKFAYDKNIYVLSDEVYQKNIYVDKEFISMRKALKNLGAPFDDNVELTSFHSLSKGLLGECGLRGGFMEVHNTDEYARQMIYKSKAVNLCSNTLGQIGVGLMVNPPTQSSVSKTVYDQFESEEKLIFDGLTSRAQLLTKKLNEIEGVTCNEVEGAMYAFPKIEFPDSY